MKKIEILDLEDEIITLKMSISLLMVVKDGIKAIYTITRKLLTKPFIQF